MQQKLRALIATVELTKDKVGLETLKELLEEAKKLEHHKDTTVGLWATDRPDLVDDPKKIMFRIDY